MKQVKTIMTANPATCTPETSIADVARMMVENDCGCIPVVESHNSLAPVGVVTDRDIVSRGVAQGRNPLELTARDVMSSPAVTVMADANMDDCVRVMEENRIRRVLVVDDQDTCCGIVSQADIALHAARNKTAQVVREVSLPKSEPAPVAAPQQVETMGQNGQH